MELVREISRSIFNLETISPGTMVYAKHKSWDQPKSGIVTKAAEEEIRVQYVPVIGTVTNYFSVRAGEVKNKEWTLAWSDDFVTIHRTEEDE